MTDILNRAADNLWSEGWDEEAAAVRNAADRIEKLEVALRALKALHHDGGIDDLAERDDRTYFMVCEALEELSAP